MRFKPGQSGNPAGRPKGVGNHNAARKALNEALPDLMKALIQQALQGDTAAAKLLIDRALPALKSVSEPVSLRCAGTLADHARTIIAETTQGRLTPDEANTLLQGLASTAKIVETQELAQRIEALENEHKRQS